MIQNDWIQTSLVRTAPNVLVFLFLTLNIFHILLLVFLLLTLNKKILAGATKFICSFFNEDINDRTAKFFFLFNITQT